MKRPADHAHFRQLISARLDGPLSVIAERQLLHHLARCADCRTVHNDYHEQRRQLRRLPIAPPPRDLWARTSTALDRELARRRPRPRSDEQRSVPRSTMIVAAAALGMALVVGTTQINVVPPPTDDGQPASPRAALPTPFGVISQRISLLGTDANGLVLFRAQVDQVCPPAALGCIDDEDLSPQVIPFGHRVVPVSVSVSPNGELVAITGRRDGHDGLLALVPTEPAPPPPVTPASPSPELPAPPASPDSPVSPRSTHSLSTTPLPPTAAPPLDPPVASIAPEPAASLPPAPAPALTAVAVMDDIQVAGAPPAWSADGTLLAFSAMPADRSHGPDLYVWRVGQQAVEALTSDHATYFASWAGERIVASRIVPPLDEENPLTVATVVIDIASGEERAIDGDGLWLPAVGPLGQRAVVWQGQLDVGETAVRPLSGALYLTDWDALDPFAEVPPEADEGGQVSPQPSAEPSLTPPIDALPTSPPGNSQRPMLTLPPGDETPAPSPSEPPPADEDPEEATVERPAITLLPIEPARDPLLEPVLDWQVRWSADGRTLGYWIADVAGASWGWLAVVDVEELAANPQTAQPVLPAVLARRHFTLGIDRVAWIGAADTQPEGEIRIRTWGSAGDGGLRIPSFDEREVVPAF